MSKNGTKFQIVIPRQGIVSGEAKVRSLMTAESVRRLSTIGPIEVRRVSNIEVGAELHPDAVKLLSSDYQLDGKILAPFENHVFVDLRLAGHAVVLGPFQPDEYDVALRAEVAWLYDHNIPTASEAK